MGPFGVEVDPCINIVYVIYTRSKILFSIIDGINYKNIRRFIINDNLQRLAANQNIS
jgi:hypothetical protein